MKILVVDGPNLNMLGVREPDLYGERGHIELQHMVGEYCEHREHSVSFVQSNHEGVLIDAIHQAYYDGVDGIILNPAAYTHTSIALLDAVKSVPIPTVEVHLTDIDEREEFRRISYVRPACIDTIVGLGFESYLRAVDRLELCGDA